MAEYEPDDLGATGQRIWDEATDEFELTEAQKVILEGACRQADQADILYSKIAELGGSYRVKGSMGQWVEAPELKSARSAQAEMRAALASIGLTKPDQDEDQSTPDRSGVIRQVQIRGT
ncbi:hypothetical protein nbrc107696_23980 [Gordonia spumicola]|uniref:Terminase n=1 Tax=Gordonia spumicola TaxID=589161 RepID=A0A7I9V9N3_9ACTN|nr:P27 family phage terminase small subunit [Gordonia spumicola]GEE01952.1 hypothetical protein nbrc107696_23980 [Gordonia spumicola]